MNAVEKAAEGPRPENMADARLAGRAAAGDHGAFAAIMRRYNRLLFRTARSILRNDEQAEDAVQEAYLLAFRNLHSFRAEARLSTWLVRITAYQALGMLRKRSAEVIPLDATTELSPAHTEPWMDRDSHDQPEAAAARAELRSLIEARIDRLPDTYRTVFVLRAVEELTVEETAAALGIPEATVRTKFFRARALMREGLARDMDTACEDAFTFDGERCDRIVERVLARLAR